VVIGGSKVLSYKVRICQRTLKSEIISTIVGLKLVFLGLLPVFDTFKG